MTPDQAKEAGTIAKHTIDVAIGAGGVTSHWWWPAVHQVNEIAATVTLWGGAILVVIRIWLALRDSKK